MGLLRLTRHAQDKSHRHDLTPLTGEILPPSAPEPRQFFFGDAQVRVVELEGEPWFVATDVARVLGYVAPDNAIRAHCKAPQTSPIETVGQVRHVTIIPERDVYRLVMRSKLPAAERFEEWVVGTVLPAIRKNGGYVAGQEKLATGEMADAEFMARAVMVGNGHERFVVPSPVVKPERTLPVP